MPVGSFTVSVTVISISGGRDGPMVAHLTAGFTVKWRGRGHHFYRIARINSVDPFVVLDDQQDPGFAGQCTVPNKFGFLTRSAQLAVGIGNAGKGDFRTGLFALSVHVRSNPSVSNVNPSSRTTSRTISTGNPKVSYSLKDQIAGNLRVALCARISDNVSLSTRSPLSSVSEKRTSSFSMTLVINADAVLRSG
jgi:hypothetical protein